jgi:hypothetical protein
VGGWCSGDHWSADGNPDKSRGNGLTMEEVLMDAIQVMEEANRIIEDFPLKKYILYFVIFTIEVILLFWLGLSI